MNQLKLYHSLIKPSIELAYDMERTGITIDLNAKEEIFEELKKLIISNEKEIWELAGEQFKISSTLQLSHILFSKLQLPTIQTTKTGAPATDEQTLRALIEDDDTFHPILPLILENRHILKLINSYVNKLPTFIRADGRVHPTIFITGTETGRWSIKDPPLETIPAREDLEAVVRKRGAIVRKMFVPREGYVLVDVDLAQAELRTLGYESGDPELRRAAIEDIDLHSVVASGIFNIPLEEFLAKKKTDKSIKLKRTTTKNIQFGWVYLGLTKGLMKRIPALAAFTYTELEEARIQYFKKFYRVREFQYRTVYDAIKNGRIYNCFGRARHCPVMTEMRRYKSKTIGSILEGTFYEAYLKQEVKAAFIRFRNAIKEIINAKIQGTSVDFFNYGLIEVNNWVKEHKFPAHPWNQIHDSASFEVKKGYVDEFIGIAREKINTPKSPMDIPMKAEFETSDINWYSMKEYING